MIVEFSVENFKSIKDLQTVSFVAAAIASKDKTLDDNNVFKASDKEMLLKTIGLYGANGSGKSNLIKALQAMTTFVKESFNNDKLGSEIVTPFAYNTETVKKPTFFQIVFILSGKKYRYGFEILGNQVVSEWLFGTANKNEVPYFTREKNKIDINKSQFSEGLGAEKKTRATTLFLNVADALNGHIAESIRTYLTDYIIVSSSDLPFRALSLQYLENVNDKKDMLVLLNNADLGIQELTKIDIADLPEHTKKALGDGLLIGRKVDNGQDKDMLLLPFDIYESEGTKKFFNYSSVILMALKQGKALILDEFDAKFHSLLSKKIIQLFHSEANKTNAQLLFVTHDTNLLDTTLLRRDQIYFAEKTQAGVTSFYSLSDFKGIRNDASFEKDYIKGKYGAVPFLGNFQHLVEYGF